MKSANGYDIKEGQTGILVGHRFQVWEAEVTRVIGTEYPRVEMILSKPAMSGTVAFTEKKARTFYNYESQNLNRRFWVTKDAPDHSV